MLAALTRIVGGRTTRRLGALQPAAPRLARHQPVAACRLLSSAPAPPPRSMSMEEQAAAMAQAGQDFYEQTVKKMTDKQLEDMCEQLNVPRSADSDRSDLEALIKVQMQVRQRAQATRSRTTC